MRHIRRNPLRTKEILLFIVVMLVATFLRMGDIGITEFKRDEAVLSQLARNVATGEDLPLLGMGSSTGFPNSPVSVYLFAIPYFFGSTPVLGNLFVVMMNLIALALIWKFARRYYGRVAAFVAGLAFAVNPWAVIYSRKIWAQNLLMPFVMATIFTGTLGFLEHRPKRWAQFWHLPLLALTVQVHFAGLTLVPLSLLILWIGRRNIRREFWLSLILMGLLSLPFLIGLSDNGWLEAGRITDVLNDDSEQQSLFSLKALEYTWFTIAGTNIHSLAGPDAFNAYQDSLPPFTYEEFRLWMVFALVLMAWWVWRNRSERSLLIILLMAWLAIPVLFFTFEWTAVQPHYFIPAMPAFFILLGSALTQFWRRPPLRVVWRQLFSYTLLIFLFISVLQAWSVSALFRFLDTHYTPGGFGIPLHYLLDVRSAVDDASPESILVYTDGDSVEFDEDPAVWHYLLTPVVDDVRFVDATRFFVFPHDGAAVLTTPTSDITRADAIFPVGEIFPARPGEGVFVFYPDPTFADPPSLALEGRLANGAQLTYLLAGDDSLLLYWTIRNVPDRDYVAFIHVMDADDNLLAQADIPFWRSENWRQGDVIAMTMPINLEGGDHLRIGMYHLESGQYVNTELLDQDGSYVDQHYTIHLE